MEVATIPKQSTKPEKAAEAKPALSIVRMDHQDPQGGGTHSAWFASYEVEKMWTQQRNNAIRMSPGKADALVEQMYASKKGNTAIEEFDPEFKAERVDE